MTCLLSQILRRQAKRGHGAQEEYWGRTHHVRPGLAVVAGGELGLTLARRGLEVRGQCALNRRRHRAGCVKGPCEKRGMGIVDRRRAT